MAVHPNKTSRRRLIPKCGRFWVWVEYRHSSDDLDTWIHHVAGHGSSGGGHGLDDDMRDLSWDISSKPSAIAMGRRIAKVMALARSKGDWHAYVTDTQSYDEKNERKTRVWSAVGIQDPARWTMTISEGFLKPFLKHKNKRVRARAKAMIEQQRTAKALLKKKRKK